MTLVIAKMDGGGLSNTAYCKHLLKKTGDVVLATEGGILTTQQYEQDRHFSYKGEWTNVYQRRPGFSFTVIILA